MFINTEEYINFLIKHDITANQFLLAYLLNMENGAVVLYKYMEEGQGWTMEEVDDLVAKGFIFSTNHTKSGQDDYYLDRYLATSTFKNLVFIECDEAFEEILEMYPTFIIVEGKKYSTKGGPIEKLSKTYNRLIHGNMKTHEKVKEALNYGIDNHLINMGMTKWVESRQWDVLLKEKAKGVEGGYGLTRA